MDTRSDGGSHFLALERGEMFTETVTRFLADRAIRAGFVSAIGMLEDARLAWYDLETKTYRERVATGPREIASLTGNVTVRDGKPFLHAHAVLAAPDCTLLGGHFFEGRVAAAAEVVILAFQADLVRRHDAATGLHLVSKSGIMD